MFSTAARAAPEWTILGRREELAAGIVDQYIKPPVALDQAVEEALDRLLVADVEHLMLE